MVLVFVAYFTTPNAPYIAKLPIRLDVRCLSNEYPTLASMPKLK